MCAQPARVAVDDLVSMLSPPLGIGCRDELAAAGLELW
jgi:hypothetical protein